MDIHRILEPSRIACAADARSKKRALEKLSDLLAAGEDAVGQGAVFTALLGRERLGSTAVGHGVAIPHGRLAGLDRVRGAFLHLDEPVDFEADDGQPVDLLIGLLVPAECGDEHLAVLAAIAERIDDAHLRGALRKARDASAVMDAFDMGPGAGRATG